MNVILTILEILGIMIQTKSVRDRGLCGAPVVEDKK